MLARPRLTPHNVAVPRHLIPCLYPDPPSPPCDPFSLLSPFPFNFKHWFFPPCSQANCSRQLSRKKGKEIIGLRRGLWVVLVWGDLGTFQPALDTARLCELEVQLHRCPPSAPHALHTALRQETQKRIGPVAFPGGRNQGECGVALSTW